MTQAVPLVLVIDDHPELVALQQNRTDISLRPIHPGDLRPENIEEADLILVDHVLADWKFDETLAFACQPSDGVALAAIVRAHLRRMNDASPAALALYSGALRKLTLDNEPQEHLIAMTYGLEWAFPKVQTVGRPDLDCQVGALAQAVKLLPRIWSSDDPDELAKQVETLLGIGGKEWSVLAFAEVERCRPPIHQLSEWTSGLALLRWLLHRVLPYPCFLLEVSQLALRLRVPFDWLAEQLSDGRALRNALEEARYTGALAGFLGDRWWWSACDSLMRGTIGAPTSIQQVHAWLKGLAGANVPLLDLAQPVLTFDAIGRFASIAPMKECVRIQPDTWPSYAVEPWCRKDDARKNSELKRLVVTADLDAVESDGAGA